MTKVFSKAKNIITLAALLLGLCFGTFAQNGPIKDRLSVKVGGQLLHSKFLPPVDAPWFWDNVQYRIELNYGFENAIEFGAYIGHIFPIKFIEDSATNSYNFTDERNYGLAYGVSINFHLLPLFIKANNFRFDIYTSINIGGNTLFLQGGPYIVGSLEAKYQPFEMFLLGGFTYYLTRHIGINTEVNFRKHLNYYRHVRLSVVYKIKRKSN